jgi:hypothetical protein
MTQDRSHWWALVNISINVQIPLNVGISQLAEELLASRGLYTMELFRPFSMTFTNDSFVVALFGTTGKGIPLIC